MTKTLRKWLYVGICLCFVVGGSAQVGYITSTLNDTVCSGSSGFVSAHGIVGSVTTWQYDIGAGFQNIPSSAGDTSRSVFSIPNNTCYRFIHNGGADTSAVFCITVYDASSAGTITGGGQQCGVANGTMVVTGSNGTPLGWYMSTGGAYTSTSNTSTSQAFNVSQTTYYAFVTQNGVCPADTSRDTISIVPYSNAGLISPATSTVCITANATTISSSGITGNVVGWESAPALGGPWTVVSDSNSTYDAVNVAAPTFYHLIVKSGICPADTSNPAQILIDQAPVGGTLSGGIYYCGTPPATGMLTLSGYSGTIVQWQYYSGGSWTTGPCTGNTCPYSVSSTTKYRVEVSNGVCPTTFSTYDTVVVSPSSVAGSLASSKDTVCALLGGGSLDVTGSVGTSYSWEFSANGTSWSPMSAFTSTHASFYNLPQGTYYFHCIVQNNLCSPATSNSVTVVVSPSPTVSISTNDTLVVPGDVIHVTASGVGNPTWSPSTGVSDPFVFVTDITPQVATDYVITVDDGSGCTGTDTLHIYMLPPPPSDFISNTLTPNEDGINDAFFVDNIELHESSDLEIFNEYGQSIYTASPYKNDWKGTYNGSRVPDGTYYYILKVKDQQTINEYKGFVTILGGN